jgi:hypothetical protein
MSRRRRNRISPATAAGGTARRAVPEQEPAPAWPAPAAQSVAWARRRSEQDREAQRLCRQYKAFLTRYGLTDSVLAKADVEGVRVGGAAGCSGADRGQPRIEIGNCSNVPGPK